MKIQKATMRAIDRRGTVLRAENAVKVTLKGNIRLILTTDRDGAPTAEVRRYVKDADLAREQGQETGDDHVLMDWFELVDVRVMFYDDTMTLTGYTESTEGRQRGGQPLRKPAGDALMTRVEWVLR